MLIEFRVANYRSVGEEQIISLIPAAKQKEFEENILSEGRYKALNAVAFYGNNASGKSNLLDAMRLLDRLIHLSAKSSSTTPLPYDPFLLKKSLSEKPTSFEITFFLNGARYRYGLEYTKEAFTKEWLFRKTHSREVTVFEREGDVIETPSMRATARVLDAAIEATRPNALFLSFCDIFNIEEAKNIFQWFRNYNMVDGIQTEDEEFHTITLWHQEKAKSKIVKHLKELNLNIQDLDVTTKPFDISELPENMPEDLKATISKEMSGKESYSVWSKHRIYNEDGSQSDELHTWKLDDNESEGTKKAFHLSGPIVGTLSTGGVLIIDEIEAKMHPIMTLHTINLFLDRKTNPKGAQLIFATHDTNLLTYCKLRRDQIYFTEKNEWESTEIYSLSDYVYKDEKERPDSDKEKRYFEGRYGAIPILGNFKPVKVKEYGKKGEVRE